MTKFPQLEIYFYRACPYCYEVLEKIKELNLEVNYCNTWEDPDHIERLIAVTGRSTVPCLFIDGSPMHESLDIIRWLEDNQDHLKKKT